MVDRKSNLPLSAWFAVVAGAGLVTLALEAVSVPSAPLMAGLMTGMAAALIRGVRIDPPGIMTSAAHAVTGVVVGQLVTSQVLRAVADNWASVAISLLATLVIALIGGRLLSAFTGLDQTTSMFGSLPGGASGVIALSEDAGANVQLVAVMQYLRVLFVVLIMPSVVALLHMASTRPPPPTSSIAGPSMPGLLFVVVATGIGIGLGYLLRLPTPSLLGPLAVVVSISLIWPSALSPTPHLLRNAAFVAIGLQVGLRFDRERLRSLIGVFMPILVEILVLIAGCALVASALATWTGRPYFDWYLATTPGGLYAVLAVAIQYDVDAGFVSSVQVLRILAMLLVAPLLARSVKHHRTEGGTSVS